MSKRLHFAAAAVLLTLPLAAQRNADTLPNRVPPPKLITLAQAHDPGACKAVADSFLPRDLKSGRAFATDGKRALFAISGPTTQPVLQFDGKPLAPPTGCPEGAIWYGVGTMPEGAALHSAEFLVSGKAAGGNYDIATFGPLSSQQPGVPSGKLLEHLTMTSKIYDGMKTEYAVYIPAQYDPAHPAALMVFQDGLGQVNRNSAHHTLNVVDNLIAQGKIPVMICIFANPGTITDSVGTPIYSEVKPYADRVNRQPNDAMRSTEYDTVSDRFPRFLRDELIPLVSAQYKIRADAYSRAIAGGSSGGIAAFNAAWQMPDQFSRVVSWIGSFDSIQWHRYPNENEGGQDYPDKILNEDHRNLRVWLQDGSHDQSFPQWGDWPLNNIRMANSLKSHDYDFHFHFGNGTHNGAEGGVMFPQTMLWLWRGYDPTKTTQTYTMEPSEKAKPLFQVNISNRDAD